MDIVDLHTHSTRSDGTLTPKEIINLAKKEGIKAIALTDHDTLNGVEEAAKEAESLGIEFVRGCEISSTLGNAKVHVLGYFPDGINEKLKAIFEERRKSRHTRVKKICENLRAYGVYIYYEEIVEDEEKESPGRANAAEILVKKGYAENIPDAFNKYLTKGRPGYAESVRITPHEAVRIITENGGKAYIAHLNQIKCDEETLFALLSELKECGLTGIEGYYSEYTKEDETKYRGFAKKLDLSLCGGSDFHGSIKPKIALGKGFGDLSVPYEIYENLVKTK